MKLQTSVTETGSVMLGFHVKGKPKLFRQDFEDVDDKDGLRSFRQIGVRFLKGSWEFLSMWG